jgi:hypothetical protein
VCLIMTHGAPILSIFTARLQLQYQVTFLPTTAFWLKVNAHMPSPDGDGAPVEGFVAADSISRYINGTLCFSGRETIHESY